jgi:predicted negative regulator of RcsB-dependent stress response
VIGFLRRLSDDRYRRAQKRRRTEEIMGWICVPLLLFVGWFGWQAWEQANPGRPQGADTVLPSTTTIRRN